MFSQQHQQALCSRDILSPTLSAFFDATSPLVFENLLSPTTASKDEFFSTLTTTQQQQPPLYQQQQPQHLLPSFPATLPAKLVVEDDEDFDDASSTTSTSTTTTSYVPIRPANVPLLQLPDFLSNNKPWHTKQIDRKWKLTFQDDSLINASNTLNVELTSKTRCEEPADQVPENLYSSLKYQLCQKITGTFCTLIKMLVVRVVVVDSRSLQEVKKDNKPVIEGDTETSLHVKQDAATGERRLEAAIKVKFNDVSYHHDNKLFCFQVSYFHPSNLQRPVVVYRSAPFKVLARKPSQGKKRKADSAFDQFNTKFDELLQCSKRLKLDQRSHALDAIVKLVHDMDPEYFGQALAKATATNPATSLGQQPPTAAD